MKPDQFNRLTKEEAQVGFEECADNADIHFKVAELLAKENHIPIANSHLILAVEEATKAIFLFYKYQLNHIAIPVEGMFTKHKTKHKFAKDNYDYLHQQLVKLSGQLVEANKITFNEEYYATLPEPEAFTTRAVMDIIEAKHSLARRFDPKKNDEALTFSD